MIDFEFEFQYAEAKLPILRQVGGGIPAGRCVVLCGGSGCGKSTLLRCINGLIPQFYEGELKGFCRLNGQDTAGLRIGEICGLKWGDFDLSAGTVTIQRTVTRISCGNGHTKVIVQSPKTQNSHREIPLPKSLLRVLKKLSKDFSSGTWFLSGNEEKPVEPRCYRKSIYGYLKKASVHQAHPHALRHTFATTCLQAHCDIKTLSELLGHADAAVTLKKYVHSDMTRKRKEINRVFENF